MFTCGFILFCGKIVYYGGIHKFEHSQRVQDLLSGNINVPIPSGGIWYFLYRKTYTNPTFSSWVSLNISLVNPPIFALLLALLRFPFPACDIAQVKKPEGWTLTYFKYY